MLSEKVIKNKAREFRQGGKDMRIAMLTNNYRPFVGGVPISVERQAEELIKSGLSYRVSKLPMAYSGRFVAENEQGNGLCKLIQDEEGKIIGCHILGNPASELIVIAGIALFSLSMQAFSWNVLEGRSGSRGYRSTFRFYW